MTNQAIAVGCVVQVVKGCRSYGVKAGESASVNNASQKNAELRAFIMGYGKK